MTRPRLRPWMLVSAAFLAMASLGMLRAAANRRLNGMGWEFHDLFFESGGDWLVCAALTPLIFIASRKWPLAGPRWASHALLHFGLAILFWAAVGIIYQGLLALQFNHHVSEGLRGLSLAQQINRLGARSLDWILPTLLIRISIYFYIVGVEHAFRYFVEARDRAVHIARLSEQLSGARYAALQAQLNPHFLFNTLNTIAVRARDGDGTGTARMVEQLSELLRRTLGRDRTEEVSLADELQLVRDYVDIEQARFFDRLHVRFEVEAAALSAAVPAFALQHLVENAIRHGIAPRREAGHIIVSARRDAGGLELCVSDDGDGIVAVPAPGHGIEDTRERLRVLYGSAASLEVTARAGGGTIATLRLPYRLVALEAHVASS